MSGGSYNYLCFSDTVAEAVGHPYLEDMAKRLEGLDPNHPVTRYTRGLIQPGVEVPQPVKDVWKAIEWRDSGDWGDNDVEEALTIAMNPWE